MAPRATSRRAGPSLNDEQLLDMYYYLRLNRALEERLVTLYRQGHIVGGLYSSLGQEGISVGSAYALEKGDFVAPMIRNIGTVLVRGYTPREIMAQHLARATGPNHGKDSNLHFSDLERGVVGCISMLSTLVPVMTGVALALRKRGLDAVAMTYVGDGATSCGDFHEGLNFASVLKVPFVLIVENNQWAYSTPLEKQSNIHDFYRRADAYGIPGHVGDGNDVMEVYRITKKAVASARAGGGPQLIEFKTMRMKGHAEHDDARYVPKETFEEWRKRDPIARFELVLESKGLLNPEQKEAVSKRVEAEVTEAERFAIESPLPHPSATYQDVFADRSLTPSPPWYRL